MSANKTTLFPCPICGDGLEIRTSKKDKPYVVCDACGMQLFVRLPKGIRRMEELVRSAAQANIWDRIRDLDKHYLKHCPKCGREFWLHESGIATSWFDGEFQGYKCPGKACGGVVKARTQPRAS